MSPKNRFRDSRAREGVFISYARSDGGAIAAALRKQLESEGIPLWQDVIAMEGGRDWWLQITDALDQVEFMALVITPNALKSDTVRKEGRYARQEGVCVYPIKGTPDLDFANLPHWLRDKHLYDLADKLQWQKFLNDLNSRCETPRVPFMVEDLPTDFVARPDEFDQLITHLCNREGETPIAITAALRGAGGYGKTTLANALCHNEDVQDHYEDGILWVTLGEKPGDLTGHIADLVETLSGERPGFTDVNAAAVRLRELLVDRRVLVVIDDVWDLAHLTPFMHNAGRGAQLITTRNVDTLPPDAKRVDVDAMRRSEAIALLSAGLADLNQSQLRSLAKRLGEWPLLLKIANGILRNRIHRLGQGADAAFGWVNASLDRRGLTAFDARNAQAREQTVKKTLDVSLDLLEPEERERYGELAVFPEDVEIPLTTLAKLWGQTGGLDEFDTEALCDRLDRLSLLQRFDPNRRMIGLHDVIRHYLIGEQGDSLPHAHAALLAAHRPTKVNRAPDPSYVSWADLGRDEPYLWDHLAYHLTAAGRGDELILTAKDLRYLAAKTVARNALAVEQDLLEAEKFAMSDALQRLLRRSFVQSAHMLDRCQDRNEAEATLYARLLHEDKLVPLTEVLAQALRTPFVAPLYPLPDLPDPTLVRTLSGHVGFVEDCAISVDESVIVSASHDGTLRIWDVDTGAVRHSLIGHMDEPNGLITKNVNGCAISADGTLIVSASRDKTLKIWEAEGGAERLTLSGHQREVNNCAISPDGTFIVSASNDGTLKVWDVGTGAELLTLTGHTGAVFDCAISFDSRFIVSAGADKYLKIWDPKTGVERLTLSGHKDGVRACVISSDNAWVVSASHDKTVKVWDAKAGVELLTLSGHSAPALTCAISNDKSFIVSGSFDNTLRVWDAKTGAARLTHHGHTFPVSGCAISNDGVFIVSASLDTTLKIWDARDNTSGPAHAGHQDWVMGCDISRDGSLVASASWDDTVKLWDAKSGAQLQTLQHHTGVNGCAFNSDGTVIVSALDDKTLKVWSTLTGNELFTLSGHKHRVRDCAVSLDGSLIVSASTDDTLKLWDARSGNELLTLRGHRNTVRRCAISRDSSFILSASSDTTMRLWDARSGIELRTLVGHTEDVRGCAISVDGSLLVSASWDGTVKVWEKNTGLVRLTLDHQDPVNSCAISGDGKFILSVSSAHSLKLWDARNGDCLTTLHVDGALHDCAWSSKNNEIVAVGDCGVYFLRLVL